MSDAPSPQHSAPSEDAKKAFRRSPFRKLRLFTRRGFRAFIRGGTQYFWGKRGGRRVLGWRALFRLRAEAILRVSRPIGQMSLFPVARLWVDGEAFPRVKKLLRAARHTIVIQMFIWKDDHLGRDIASILTEAADRGVQIDISKEAVGDVFEFTRDFLTTKESKNPLWQRFWTHPNIRITYTSRNDHTKVYIIDDQIMLLSGMNIADEYHEEWHDYMVELRGQLFVQHFLSDGETQASDGDATIVMNTDTRKAIRGAVMQLINSASKSIVLEQAYLSDEQVLRGLIQRSHDDVQVTVILPQKTDFHHFVNMQSIAQLLAEGKKGKMSIFLYPRMVHGKIILVDRERAFVGSANLMASSLDEMGEVNVLLQGKLHPAIGKLRDVLREDVFLSTPVSRPPRFQWLWNWLTLLKL
jgi:cardiolipin synthase